MHVQKTHFLFKIFLWHPNQFKSATVCGQLGSCLLVCNFHNALLQSSTSLTNSSCTVDQYKSTSWTAWGGLSVNIMFEFIHFARIWYVCLLTAVMKVLFHGNGSTEVSVLSLKKTKQPQVIISVFVPQRFAPWTLCFTPFPLWIQERGSSGRWFFYLFIFFYMFMVLNAFQLVDELCILWSDFRNSSCSNYVNRIGPTLLIMSVWVYLETKGSHYMVICCI